MCGGGLQSSCILLVMFLNSDTISNMPVPTGENAFSFCSPGEKKEEEKTQQILVLSSQALLYLFNSKEHLISSGVGWGVKNRPLNQSQKNESVEAWA